MATAQIAGWVTDALAHREHWPAWREVDERTGAITTLAVIAARERVQAQGETVWTERVLVARSARAQGGLRRRRERLWGRVAEQVTALSRPARHGRRVYRTVAAVETAVADLRRAAGLEGVVWIQPREHTRREGTACWTVGA